MIPQPKLEPIHGTGLRLFERKRYRLSEDFFVRVSGRAYCVKAGFEFDGASVPTVFKWLLSEAAIMSIAALLHDWLYHSAELSKEEADATFHAALKDVDGVRWFDYRVMWLALVMFGQAAWDEHRAAGHSVSDR